MGPQLHALVARIPGLQALIIADAVQISRYDSKPRGVDGTEAWQAVRVLIASEHSIPAAALASAEKQDYPVPEYTDTWSDVIDAMSLDAGSSVRVAILDWDLFWCEQARPIDALKRAASTVLQLLYYVFKSLGNSQDRNSQILF